MTPNPDQTGPVKSSGGLYRALANSRSRHLLLQCLVSIGLSYQLLFGSESIISRFMSDGLVIGLWLLIAVIAVLPQRVLEATWFSAGLVVIDTFLVTATIYLSGNARPDLYIAYFVLMLVAASVRRLSHLLSLSLLLSLGYGAVLYEGVIQNGTLSIGHLLGVPVLMVMAVFYGLALETITVERQQKSKLLQDVEVLKKTEDQLVAAKEQLEVRITGLKEDLAKADENLRQGLTMRQGLERQLREAQKMEAVGRIAAGIASEFGTLFSVIGKQTGVLLSQMRPEDPLRASVDDIFKTGEKAATLTAELIALNLDQARVRQAVSVKKVLVETQSAIRSLLPAGIQLKMFADESPSYAEVDREGLEKVLFQLVVNARDAMPAGGQLVIEVSTAVGEAGDLRHSEAGAGSSQILIKISDTGTGMNLDTQDRMFEPFFSTKETNIGLGLTAVYGIVKQNGGVVDVESRPGEGTVVRVFLPEARSQAFQEEPLAKGLLAKGDETVLLVEEDEIDRKLALSVLERYKYHVLEAASSIEALMVTQKYKGSVHLAVSPLLMPEIGGRELARRLLSQHPAMKALFVSSYDDDTIQHHRINRRFVLQHPYRQAGLVEKVREMLDAA